MKYEKFIVEHQRLIVLRLLAEDTGYAHNDSILKSALAAVGHSISADKLQTELAWLAEQDLITTERVGGFIVAKLTTRGLDVAQGRTQTPGVGRPGPDC